MQPLQILCGLMTTPPVEGDPSFDLFQRERSEIFESLKRKAKFLHGELNKIKGISCAPIQGALYAFPRVTLPDKVVVAADEAGFSSPDEMFCMQMVEETGVVCVPGGGFGQEHGTHHFRMTILPSDEALEKVVRSVEAFYKRFLERYS